MEILKFIWCGIKGIGVVLMLPVSIFAGIIFMFWPVILWPNTGWPIGIWLFMIVFFVTAFILYDDSKNP